MRSHPARGYVRIPLLPHPPSPPPPCVRSCAFLCSFLKVSEWSKGQKPVRDSKLIRPARIRNLGDNMSQVRGIWGNMYRWGIWTALIKLENIFNKCHVIQMWRIKRICVLEHSVMINFNCVCPAIQRGQGSGFLSEGSSWLPACTSEQRRFWRDCADVQARLNLRCSHRR